ncbi:MAG: hypothetical protein Q8N30_08600 [Methylococcales bacterium]|nr:hypothetical protein [Methylococcales bacterium]
MKTDIIKEEMLPYFGFKGTVEVSESDPVNGIPNIIRTTDAWFVEYQLTAKGWLNYFLNPSVTWDFEILLEKRGKGEFELPDTLRIHHEAFKPAVFPGSTEVSFTKRIDIPAGSVEAGTYAVLAEVKMSLNGHPLPLAGYADLGIFQFFES